MLKWSVRWEHWYRRLLPAYWVFLFACTHFPKLQLGGAAVSDKFVHLVAFGLLAFLYWKFVESFRRPVSNWFALHAAVLLVAYASLDEYTQAFVGRGADWRDWLANLAGIAGVLFVLDTVRRVLPSSTSPPANESGDPRE